MLLATATHVTLAFLMNQNVCECILSDYVEHYMEVLGGIRKAVSLLPV